MRDELTTQFSQLKDVLVEADYWARQEHRDAINREMILKANDERTFFSGISEERINKDIITGELVINLAGYKVGMVNGLAVMDFRHLAPDDKEPIRLDACDFLQGLHHPERRFVDDERLIPGKQFGKAGLSPSRFRGEETFESEAFADESRCADQRGECRRSWYRTDGKTRFTHRTDQTRTGVADARRPCIADIGHIQALGKKLDDAFGAVDLIIRMGPDGEKVEFSQML